VAVEPEPALAPTAPMPRATTAAPAAEDASGGGAPARGRLVVGLIGDGIHGDLLVE
jgi:hypothetical protein